MDMHFINYSFLLMLLQAGCMGLKASFKGFPIKINTQKMEAKIRMVKDYLTMLDL